MLHINISRKSRLKIYQMQDVTNFSYLDMRKLFDIKICNKCNK